MASGSKKQGKLGTVTPLDVEVAFFDDSRHYIAFIGPDRANLNFISSLFGNLTFAAEKQRLYIKADDYNVAKQKDPYFVDKLCTVLDHAISIISEGDDLSIDRIQAGYMIAVEDVERALSATEENTFSQPMSEALSLRLCGANGGLIYELGKFYDLELYTAGDVVAANINAVREVNKAQPGKILRMKLTIEKLMTQLERDESLVLTPELMAHVVKTVDQIPDDSLPTSMQSITDDGHVVRYDVNPTYLLDTDIFESVVSVEALETADKRECRVLLTFSKGGMHVQSVLRGHNNMNLPVLSEVFKNVVFDAPSGGGLALVGAEEIVFGVVSSLVKAAQIIDQNGYKQHDDVAAIYKHVLNPSETPLLPAKLKGKAKAQAKEPAHLSNIKAACLEPRTENHKKLFAHFEDKNTPIVIVTGQPGTAKTTLAVQSGLTAALRDNLTLVVSIACVGVDGEKTGFLPGDVGEKSSPWASTIYEPIAKLLAPVHKDGTKDMIQGRKTLEELKADSRIVFASLAHLRGKTIDDAIIILDEAQNLSTAQMKTFLTRLGANSRLFLLGDLDQQDTAKPVFDKTDPVALFSSISTRDGQVYLRRSEGEMCVGPEEHFGYFYEVDRSDLDVGNGSSLDGTSGVERLPVVLPYSGLSTALLLLGSSDYSRVMMLGPDDVCRSALVQNISKRFRAASLRLRRPQNEETVEYRGVIDPEQAEGPTVVVSLASPIKPVAAKGKVIQFPVKTNG